ncbi:DsrE family protein [Glaciecola sp.]|jgi:intracellular sulfur oxidation DsrE/DsrF family protein|uniref:DsrE family protein n=1 Tax=Glaciecola sp. MF2-115 TaxID=3384827 RepID=UPI0039890CA7
MNRHTIKRSALFLLFFSAINVPAFAQMTAFKTGPLIEVFGKNAEVTTHTVAKDAKFKVAFDVASGADAGDINRKFDSLARFLNMHVNAGVNKDNIELALVVHGKAVFDLLNNENYQKRNSQDNPNKPLLQALMNNKVRVIVCGQSAAANGIDISQFVKGSEVELSAMTAHAQLQQAGYTVNPF